MGCCFFYFFFFGTPLLLQTHSHTHARGLNLLRSVFLHNRFQPVVSWFYFTCFFSLVFFSYGTIHKHIRPRFGTRWETEPNLLPNLVGTVAADAATTFLLSSASLHTHIHTHTHIRDRDRAVDALAATSDCCCFSFRFALRKNAPKGLDNQNQSPFYTSKWRTRTHTRTRTQYTYTRLKTSGML